MHAELTSDLVDIPSASIQSVKQLSARPRRSNAHQAWHRRLNERRDVFFMYWTIRQGDRRFDDMPQLANVPRPHMGLQRLHRAAPDHCLSDSRTLRLRGEVCSE